ncbi:MULTISPECIES: bifunctional ADP-dependent NAD(P)H-hydrate dehydratase/NAD(P)H-hydrate epimerase [unclassified Aureimonas]|uniref:bifunctional ADP-dependent NAD(P)H-hydrate dehydratase/NAD(P)H-hydrate epimerase n=1 Tax=unclassified Aureimonas TaxID=2615206 RepID=UPI0007019BF4|nr:MULTISPECIES: bifunctional ADP-dependent NAD(P)H-hydrate dehydratase/NAD(P)H-hydrate epimerase [unclassified Aureimonas]KQT60611.1 NAD(P)H-hydrate epimerase [Aureimonas sp. Leaf427]KQT79483.1 NAD(P)H-hydrate epimerase [Aureimonas sp. Leaf460]
MTALLTPREMAEADRLTIATRTSGWTLMQRAGQGIFDHLKLAFADARRIAILAGPGNNGGDAYVAAGLLAAAGRETQIFTAVPVENLSGDAALAARSFGGPRRPIEDFDAAGFDLVLDGLYGAGLSRAVEGPEARAIEAANASGLPIVAIDLPSGISGSSGAALGPAISAALTVTFFRRKPGHLLQSGRSHCGRVAVVDIGIDPGVLDVIAPKSFANEPKLWEGCFPRPADIGHKFDRGHAVVFSGSATKTGAARLSALAALRVGAGLVTLASPPSALMVNAAHLTAIMLKRCSVPDDLGDLLADPRLGTFVLGPGFGIGEPARTVAAAIVEAHRALVLDADGITSFADEPEQLFHLIAANAGDVFLTPHAGEFSRLFPDIAANRDLSKLERARHAALRSGAVVVLKGSDTVIASPDGRAAINATGTPYLATAGSGDVLSGLIAGLRSQAMPSFEAACAGVWMHGRAAEHFGPGLIAEDLPGLVPAVLAELLRPLSGAR